MNETLSLPPTASQIPKSGFRMVFVCHVENLLPQKEHQGLCSKVSSQDTGIRCKTKYLGNTFFWKEKSTFHS